MEFNLTHIVNKLPQIIMNMGPGFLLGAALGGLFRFVIVKVMILIAIPAVLIFFVDYVNLYQVDWIVISDMWNIWLRPPLIDVFNYFNKHTLAGIIPGVVIGFFLSSLVKK